MALVVHLHLNVNVFAVVVYGQNIENDLLTRNVLGQDVGVEHLGEGQRCGIAAHHIDQIVEQAKVRSEDAFEDVVVTGIEKGSRGCGGIGTARTV